MPNQAHNKSFKLGALFRTHIADLDCWFVNSGKTDPTSGFVIYEGDVFTIIGVSTNPTNRQVKILVAGSGVCGWIEHWVVEEFCEELQP